MKEQSQYPLRASTLIRWLWQVSLHRQWRVLSLAALFMALEGAMLGLISFLVKHLFDQVFVGGRMDWLWIVGLGALGIFAIRAVSSIAQRVLTMRVQQRMAADLRGGLVAKLMTMEVAYHQKNPPGHLIERVQGDVEAIGLVWNTIATGVGRDVVSVFVLFGVILWIDPLWTLSAVVGIPLLVAPSLLVQRFVRRTATSARDIAAKMAVRLDEIFHGIAPIKLNRLETYQSERYTQLLEERIDTETRSAFGQSLIPALIDIMTGLGFLCVLYFGGRDIIEGHKTLGDFMAFFTAMALVFDPLRRLGALSGQIEAASASVARIRGIFETMPALRDPAAPVAVPSGVPHIRFETLQLAYGDQAVLNGLTFTANAGETTALVGPSGAGKSTVFNLLTRLVDADSGQIFVEGAEIRDLRIADLRGLLSVVSQDAALFDETLRENIILNRTVSSEALERALDAAHARGFVETLPDGLDSAAGPRGSNLSGGQKQRIAIARALLSDAPILLLDEATSALDTKSETAVQEALDLLASGRTTLVIAHRLSTIRNADKIVVIVDGRVIEEGTHEALLSQNGTYAELYKMQFGEGENSA